jgi:hypothetical protein
MKKAMVQYELPGIRCWNCQLCQDGHNLQLRHNAPRQFPPRTLQNSGIDQSAWQLHVAPHSATQIGRLPLTFCGRLQRLPPEYPTAGKALVRTATKYSDNKALWRVPPLSQNMKDSFRYVVSKPSEIGVLENLQLLRRFGSHGSEKWPLMCSRSGPCQQPCKAGK